MVVLKKISASTLMETMVATVLIVVIFMMSSLIMNSLMATQVNANLSPIKEHLRQLEYGYLSQQLPLPYYEEWQGWNIAITSEEGVQVPVIEFHAVHSASKKEIQTIVIPNN